MVYNCTGEFMRLKHIKNADKIIEKSKYLIKDKFKFKGKWNKVFNNKNLIEVEIGMGKGNFLIKKALESPNINFIGIEKYESVLVSVVNKLDIYNLNNIKIICLNAKYINKVFKKEISKLYLNFSDPWPKKRHAKRRLTSPEFLKIYKNIFKNNYDIELKTDNDELFLYSLNIFKENGFVLKNLSRDCKSIYKTEYEEKFINKGKNINYLNVIK